MKILAIVSSGRKTGHTANIVSLLQLDLEQLAKEKKDSLQFELLFLVDYSINHCRGCRACMDHGEENCPLHDDLPKIKSKIDKADAVIFASPVYVGDLNSAMKALIDRLAYVCHRQEFYEKCAIILATTNKTSLKRTIHTMCAATYSWGFKTIARKGFKTYTSYDSIEILKQRYQKDISRLAKKIYMEVSEKSYLNPSSLSLASFKIQQKYRSNPELSSPIDYNYWHSKGWTNRTRIYYSENQISIFKKLSSKVLYILFLLFYK
ncbi:MAG: flavodoxin family protein, partial [Promethearchaeota archaeon]